MPATLNSASESDWPKSRTAVANRPGAAHQDRRSPSSEYNGALHWRGGNARHRPDSRHFDCARWRTRCGDILLLRRRRDDEGQETSIIVTDVRCATPRSELS
jgi:hypothetical protein